MFQRGGGMEAAMLSVGGAYRCKEWEATARLGLHSWHLTYLHKMKDLDLVAECDGNLMQVYIGTGGYIYKISASGGKQWALLYKMSPRGWVWEKDVPSWGYLYHYTLPMHVSHIKITYTCTSMCKFGGE